MERYDIKRSMNAFAMNLYHSLNDKTDKDENLFFGPASVYAAISMVYSGAREESAKELAKVMCLPDDSRNFHEIFSTVWSGVMKSNNKSNECSLNIANKIWIKDGGLIEQEFLSLLKKNYQAEAANVNFYGDVESARCEINKWVEEKTNLKIKDMIQANTLSNTTHFLITSAMYFYGEWELAFNVSDTKCMPFYAPNGIINVDMMYQKATYGYHQSIEYDCKVLVQSYRKSTLQFMIILPNKIDGISALEQRLYADKFEGEHMWDWTMLRHKEVHLYLPRFQISDKIDLVDALQSMGMHQLFSNADLSGMTNTKDLNVSSIAHSAYIDVNEKGTEIAVITDCGMQKACASTQFKVDRPFLLMLVDKDSEVILFWGRICKPVHG